MQPSEHSNHEGYPLRYLAALGFLGFLGLEPLGWPAGREFAKLALISLAALDSLVPRGGEKIKPVPRKARGNLTWLLFLGFLVFLWTPTPILAIFAGFAMMAFLAIKGGSVPAAAPRRR